MKDFLKVIGQSLRKGLALFRKSNPMILASATAFFTTFALSPIIVILLNIMGLYFRSENISDALFEQLSAIVGDQAAEQVHSIVMNFSRQETHWVITVVGSVVLLFVATNLLHVIKTSVHQIWNIRHKSSKKFRYTLRERVVSLIIILAIGLLFLLTTLIDTILAFLQDHLSSLVPTVDSYVIILLNVLFSILIVTVWFTLLLKYLPDARVGWYVAVVGGLLTSILFSFGQYILGRLLVYSNLATIFGASASIALILLFIFYSSMIMYFGVAFTKAFGEIIGKPVLPGKYSTSYQMNALEQKYGNDK